MSTRINKYLAELGIASRRGADDLIKKGRVLINGKKAQPGDQVSDTDEVKVGKKIVSARQTQKLVYLLYNKPVGVITTTDKRKKDNIIEKVGYGERVFPVGRLDVESSGLIILTNDGELANRLTHPSFEHEKEYVVTIEEPVKQTKIQSMAKGVLLDNKMTAPAKVKKIGKHQFSISLTEGRNRQIRRMCEMYEYTVTGLQRVRILNLHIKGIREGTWRKIRKDELKSLKYKLGLN
jgi:23S rRNA pseudouridine2604 synthase